MIKTAVKNAIKRFGFDIVNLKGPAQVYFEVDQEFRDLYDRAQKQCQMVQTDNLFRRQRHYVLNHLLRNADLAEGDICELGCWRGLSAYQMAHYVRKTGQDIQFHIFDSFEGLSQYEAVDIVDGHKQDLEQRRKQFSCSLENVQENLKEFPFIKYYKGWIPERFGEVKDKRFSFVHIDVDLYQPIYDSFQFFYPRLTECGVMVFDDYGYIQFPGAKKAVDECLRIFHNPFFVPLPSGQAFLIKNLRE